MKKLHLSSEFSYSSLAPQLPPVEHNGRLIYYHSPFIHIVDVSTGKILNKIKYANTKQIKIHNDMLFVCTNTINVLELEKYNLIYTITPSRSSILDIEFYGSFLLISLPGQIRLYRIGANKENTGIQIEPVKSYSVIDNSIQLFINAHYYGFYDQNMLKIYNYGHNEIFSIESPEILRVVLCDKQIFILFSNGLVQDVISQTQYKIEVPEDISSIWNENKRLYIAYEKYILICEINDNGVEMNERIDLEEKIQEYSGSITFSGEASNNFSNDNMIEILNEDINSAENDALSEETDSISAVDLNEDISDSDPSDNTSGDSCEISEENEVSINNSNDENSDIHEDNGGSNDEIAVSFFNASLIFTNGNNIILHVNFSITKIFSFNDDITDIVKIENKIVLSTGNGYLKYREENSSLNGEYIFDSRIIKASEKPITNISLDGSYLLIAGDHSALFTVSITDGILNLDQIRAFSTGKIVCSGFVDSRLAFVSADGIMEIYAINSENNQIENIFTGKIHEKQVNHLFCSDKFIITSSNDKKAKVFSWDGRLIKEIASERVLNCCASDKYIAVCGYKSIKTYKVEMSSSPIIEQSGAYSLIKPVISSAFINGYLVCVSDTVRIYDIEKKKCVKSYNWDITSGWVFRWPYIGGENKVVHMLDESDKAFDDLQQELRNKKEETLLADKFCREGRYKDVIAIYNRSKNYRALFKVLKEAVTKVGDNSAVVADLLSEITKASAVDMLLANTEFKQSKIFNLVLSAKILSEGIVRYKIEELYKIVNKHSEGIETLYVDLLGLDIFDRNIKLDSI
ncbi:hypothetical protein ENBRE01_0336 [Enteropsectra breve]|nr:hypothetical protein ENBRE01_0336 [Enteropsectra breve]